MATVNIDCSAIGIKKPIKITPTLSLVKETFKHQIEVTKIQNTDVTDLNEHEFLQKNAESNLDLIDIAVTFITNTLSLTEAQAKKLNEATYIDLISLENQVIYKILHPEDEEESERDNKSN